MSQIKFMEFNVSETTWADIKTALESEFSGGWSLNSVIQRSSHQIVFVLTQ